MNRTESGHLALNGAAMPVPVYKRRLHRFVMGCLGLVSLLGISNISSAAMVEDISFSVLGGDRVQLKIDLSEPPQDEPFSFTIDDPARIAVDFPGVALGGVEKNQAIGVGVARSVSAVEAAGRTRVVLDLTRLVPYELEVDGNSVVVVLGAQPGALGAQPAGATGGSVGVGQLDASVEKVDFRRGDNGEGRIVVTLSDASVNADIDQVGGNIVIDFVGAGLPGALDRKLDVVDFATPVKEVDTRPGERGARMEISTVSDSYDYLAYQSDRTFVVEVQPLSEKQAEERKRREFTGERLSLNFQDIEVRAVLQLLGDFTGLNMVASDTVTGNVTLRLKNVPWDQALDIILRARGLDIREVGNVVMVAPTEEIAAREKLELEASQQIEELAPLRTEFIQVNYAKADVLAALIKAEENNLLTERGSVTIDARTNTLIIQDIASSLRSAREMVDRLDIPVRQVLIESRIVNADDNFAENIGVRFGYGREINKNGGSDDGGTTTRISPNALSTGTIGGFFTNLPATAALGSATPGTFGVNLVAASWLLQLELSAAAIEQRVEDIASPRVITTDQTTAVIEQGVEIPYQEASSSGATTTSFKEALLSLEVTPQITPDDRVLLDLTVNQDTVTPISTASGGAGGPTAAVNSGENLAVNTKSVTTQVMVDNGETVVLGGVHSDINNRRTRKIPFFGDLPYLGFLFRDKQESALKRQLLIFVTPKILKDEIRDI